jgi:hypothetical protein
VLIDPQTAKTLVDLGFAVVFVLMVSTIGVGAIRGWWVPGWIYRKSEARSDRLDASLAKLTESVDGMRDDLAWNDRDRHDTRRVTGRRDA